MEQHYTERASLYSQNPTNASICPLSLYPRLRVHSVSSQPISPRVIVHRNKTKGSTIVYLKKTARDTQLQAYHRFKDAIPYPTLSSHYLQATVGDIFF